MKSSKTQETPTMIEKEWTSSGLKCVIKMVYGSYRCGYVAVPKGHPAYDLGYDDVPVSVHGGLTYSNTDIQNERHWFGFDCAHAGDATTDYSHQGDHFWTLEEVTKETEQLAEQLSKLTWADIVKGKLESMPKWFKSRITIKEAQP